MPVAGAAGAALPAEGAAGAALLADGAAGAALPLAAVQAAAAVGRLKGLLATPAEHCGGGGRAAALANVDGTPMPALAPALFPWGPRRACFSMQLALPTPCSERSDFNDETLLAFGGGAASAAERPPAPAAPSVLEALPEDCGEGVSLLWGEEAKAADAADAAHARISLRGSGGLAVALPALPALLALLAPAVALVAPRCAMPRPCGGAAGAAFAAVRAAFAGGPVSASGGEVTDRRFLWPGTRQGVATLAVDSVGALSGFSDRACAAALPLVAAGALGLFVNKSRHSKERPPNAECSCGGVCSWIGKSLTSSSGDGASTGSF